MLFAYANVLAEEGRDSLNITDKKPAAFVKQKSDVAAEKHDSVTAERQGIVVAEKNMTLAADSVVKVQQKVPDSLAWKPRRQNIFKRVYNFMDRIFSPPRDSNYIQVQDYNWCAMTQFTSRFELYEISVGQDLKMRVAPKMRNRVGPFFGWRWAFFGYNIDLKSIFMNGDDTDLSASIYSSAFGIDLFYRRVGGNYNIRSFNFNGIDYSDVLKERPFDGINIGMTRISLYYVFNYKRYSHQAAFSQTNRQLRSAGSPMAGFSYSHNRLIVDWNKFNELVSTVQAKDVTFDGMFEKQVNDEYSLMGGYGYNWVFSKYWLFASELTASIGYVHHHQKIDKDGEGVDTGIKFLNTIGDFTRKNLSLNGNLRLSVLYNNGPWFFGTQGVFFYYQYGNGNLTTRNLLGCAYVFVGLNF
jgi:hypothetical protein